MNNKANELLKTIAAELDISDSAYEAVVARYKSVGDWLGRDGSQVAACEPVIYPQGSIQLGTAVKPINEEDEYDVDLVCELLKLNKGSITQHRLKTLIGTEIEAYARVNGMKARPEEGRRCWTLNYADSSKFHMDTLPSIPDGAAFTERLQSKGLSNPWSQHGIAITDRHSPAFDQITWDWPQSNPKGYALWFRFRMRNQLFEAKAANVEQVANYKIKNPLQQVVQLLKRHRDMMFAGEPEDKPISVILTTLAGHAYSGEHAVTDALLTIVNNMERYITFGSGSPCILNPANPNENFADKWREHPLREKNFKRWLEQAKQDFNAILSYDDDIALVEGLIPLMGERPVDRAADEVFEKAQSKMVALQQSGPLPAQFFDVPQRERPRWPQKIIGTVAVDCWKRRKGFRPVRLQSGAPTSKHWSLHFQARTNLEHPYRVFWQVVNTGPEARAANQLRGGFYDGTAFPEARQWRESTLYTGTHWIECFIVKNDAVAARSGPFVVSIT